MPNADWRDSQQSAITNRKEEWKGADTFAGKEDTATLARLCSVSLLALLVSPATLAQGGPDPKQVEVINFPDPQNVTGSVEVTNLPEVQDVNVVNPSPPAAPP